MTHFNKPEVVRLQVYTVMTMSVLVIWPVFLYYSSILVCIYSFKY